MHTRWAGDDVALLTDAGTTYLARRGASISINIGFLVKIASESIDLLATRLAGSKPVLAMVAITRFGSPRSHWSSPRVDILLAA
jgi:hypothetical protein